MYYSPIWYGVSDLLEQPSCLVVPHMEVSALLAVTWFSTERSFRIYWKFRVLQSTFSGLECSGMKSVGVACELYDRRIDNAKS